MNAPDPASARGELGRVLQQTVWDVLVQQRHHVGGANAVSTLFIAAFVLLVPAPWLTPAVASAVVFLDPALVGLSFVGAVVLMERAAGLQRAFAVTPLSPRRYLLAKVLSLGLVGVVSGLVVGAAAASVRGTGTLLEMAWFGMILTWALLLSNAFATLLGVVLAAGCRSMNQLMIRLLLATLVLFVPLIPHLADLGDAAPFVSVASAVWPTSPMLWLFEAAFAGPGSSRAGVVVLASVLLVLWIGASWRWAERVTREEILTDVR